jgi:glutathione S-transferase
MPFKTTWVDILDIPKVRKGLNCAPVRKLNDGSDYYTLPMLEDPASGRVIGESFDIANYLDEAFLESGERLFPSDSTGTGLDYESPHKDASFFAPLTSQQAGNNADYARFNWHVDTTFSCHVALVCEHMPFNPDTAEAVRDMFARRAGVNSWDDLCIRGEAREQLKASFEQSLASLAELYMVHEDGPYLEGSRATYTDLIVGGWLIFMSAALPADEWRDFRAWHGGVFAQLHDALQKNYIQCT